jgi:pimeloyl-ACP methyl ester carboxylesterase
MTAGVVAVRDETVEVWDSRLKLHVKIAGDGPPLLYFHPLPGLTWQPLLDQLAGRYTVYAPEHPGTSPGDPQAIREVRTFGELLLVYEETIGRLGLDGPAALGQSFGGMVAADLAATFPRLFSRLVLLSPLGLWPRTTAWTAGCTGSRCRRSSCGGARTASSRWPTRRSSATASRAAGSR